MDTRGENAKLKQFLLGDSSQQQDAEEIGVQIIADRNFDEKMSFAEEELIEDFLDDALTAEEKELFYSNFLTTPERIELFEETALLRNYARTHFAEASENLTPEKKSVSFFESLRLFLSSSLMRPIAAVLIILVIGAVVWRIAFYDASGLTEIEKQYAALNAKDLNDAPEIANLTNKNLAAGTFRDTDSTAKLSAANLSEKVLFRLALPTETPKDTLVNLELVKGGQTVFKQTDLRIYQNQNGQELKVILPKTVLSRGTYQIKLSSGANYGFAVE
jgi:hypothetical protein